MSDYDARAADWDKDPIRLERASAVAIAMRGQIILSQEMSVLEFGCGTGLLSFCLQPYLGQIVLADNSKGMLKVLREKIADRGVSNMTPVFLDLISDTLPLDRYDLIYTLLTMHHILDTDQALRCFHAMLKPGGLICISDLDKEDGSFHSSDSGFNGHNGFERSELNQKFIKAGFTGARFSTCYQLPRNGRLYPLFLAIAEKK